VNGGREGGLRASLGRRLILAVLLAGGCVLAVDAVMWLELRARLHRDAAHRGQELAAVLAGGIAVFLAQPVSELDRVVAALERSGGDAGPAGRVAGGSRLVIQTLVLDAAGRLVEVEPADPELIGLDWSGQSFFRAAHGRSGLHWSDTFLASDRGEPGVTLARRWRDGVVALRIDLAALNELAGVVAPAAGGFVAVLDGNGVVIGHTDPAAARQRRDLRGLAAARSAILGGSGSMPEDWQGEAGLLSWAPVGGTGWSVLVFQPARHAFAVADGVMLFDLAALAVAMGVLATMALVVRGGMHIAIGHLTEAVDRVRAGHDARVEARFAEFAGLAAAFDGMAEAVRTREGELTRSRAAYRDLVEGVDSVILRLDRDGRIVYINPSGERLFGWTAAELAGRSAGVLLPPGPDAAGREPEAVIADLLADPVRFARNEAVCLLRGGGRRWMAWTNRGLYDDAGRLTGLLAVGSDIDERRRDAEAFQTLVEAMAVSAGEALYDTATASLAGWLGCDAVLAARADQAGCMHLLSMRPRSGIDRPDSYRLAGTPCAEAMAAGWHLVGDGAAALYPGDQALADLGIAAYAGAAIPGPDGRPCGVLACLWRQPQTVRPRLREVIELVARRIGVEISRSEAQRELEAGREVLRGFLAHLPGAAAISDRAGVVLVGNGRHPEALGLAVPTPELIAQLATASAGTVVEAEIELPAIERGPPRHFHVLRFPIPGGAELLVGHIATDETERRALRERLAHSERLDAIGQLAGGVAHDFNNQLSGILGYAELLQRQLADPRQQRQTAAIIAAAKRSAALTSQLLAFARKGGVSQGPVDLRQVVDEVLHLAERTIDPRIAVVREVPTGPAVVLGDATQLQNAILNLVINARDAMPEGGRLRLALCPAGLGDAARPAGLEHLASGVYWCMAVSDTGIGMDEAVRARLFEPFFTTKPRGKGTGLGLAAVYGTVVAHQGAIQVESRKGAGSAFTLWLPAAGEAAPAPAAAAIPHGRARILVAEDEVALRQLVAEQLGGLGYAVTAVADGIEAVERFRADPSAFDLAVLDLVMPRLGGRAALRELRAIAPRLPILIVSGFGSDDDLAACRAEGLPLVAKPYVLAELAQAVADALRAAERSDS
jgi:PAS domain S-box-containing protein